jgi:hypothetical protein
MGQISCTVAGPIVVPKSAVTLIFKQNLLSPVLRPLGVSGDDTISKALVNEKNHPLLAPPASTMKGM